MEENEIQNVGKIIPINIETKMKEAYIDYSMSVIVSRALPDVRDGLKPVHRRVLYGMLDLGVYSNKPYKKSARIVGEVLGKYHPHGDSSVYFAMVRMAQDWSLRYPLVEGQGNYGSIDGDPPAAMRYTEARLRKLAEEMLKDIDKDTVDFQNNFDDTLKEPKVLPAAIPNLLINGSSGIAVGMATNMAPHNLTEVCNGIIAYIDNRDITIPELMEFIKAPDFPTAGIIYGYDGVKDALETGRGRIVTRGETKFEDSNGRTSIIINSIPYQVNKSEMIQKTAELVNEKKIEGISEIRDESDRDGMRIVYELKRDAIANVVLNNLYRQTDLQTSFSVNNIALVKGKPRTLNLKDQIVFFIEHRHEVLLRRTRFELAEAEKRAHILEGLIIACDNIDEVIAIIRGSKTPDEAREALCTRFNLSDIQSRAIVDMRLRQLTGLEIEKLKAEYDELLKLIAFLNNILVDEVLQYTIIKNEITEIRDKYGDERKTKIEYSAADFKIEDTIPDEAVVITISHMGYVKRTPLSEYRTQNRGGMGSKGVDARDEDFIEHLYIATNHNYLLLFTEQGKCFWLRVFEIPEGSKASKGRAIQNLINIPPDDKVKAYLRVNNLDNEEYLNSNYIILCTKNGIIKKTSLEAYSRPRQNGINAVTIRDKDHLLEARLTTGTSEIIMALKSGKSIRFNEEKVRPMGRNASGVKGVSLASAKDEVVGMICVKPEDNVLVVSEKGYGKRSELEEYRVTNRGGKGVKAMNITDKTGNLMSILNVTDKDDLMIITKNGILIRLSVASLRVIGRATQGVRLINLKETDSIASVAKVKGELDVDVELEDGSVILGEINNEDLDNEGTSETTETTTEE